ncbi:MAG: ribosome hibernation-promoting factor, HPF/YfiA family, partial [Gammaproteobacteria bacterium]
MHINMTGHHVDITDPLREYVNSKMDKVIRHFDNLIDVHCILTV